MTEVAGLGLLALAAAGMARLDVPLPGGGAVSLGHAVFIALVCVLSPGDLAIAVTVALVVGLVLDITTGRGVRGTAVARTVVATALAAAVANAFGVQTGSGGDPEALRTLGTAMAAGAAYLAVEAAVQRPLSLSAVLGRLRAGGAVYVSLLSSAALLALAFGLDVWLVVIAALPLLATRFAFQRYSAARHTYRQTIQALSIVPELAGHVALGHGERTAAYVGEMAEVLGIEGVARERLITAARLHHIGHIALPETGGAVDPALVGRAGAAVLRETGFLADVAEVVGAMSTPDADDADVHAALIDVASSFDDLVGEQHQRANGALAILGLQVRDAARRQALTALRTCCQSRPELVESAAAAAGRPFTGAVAAPN